MKIIVGVLSLVLFCGCASLPSGSKKELSRSQTGINQNEVRVRELEALLAQKEAQLQEKDILLRQLKDKLRGFGVF